MFSKARTFFPQFVARNSILKNINFQKPLNSSTFKPKFSFANYNKPSTPWHKVSYTNKQKKIEMLWEAGLWLTTFGLCYMAIPFYTLICQHLGFDTDLKQKDYSVMTQDPDKYPELGWEFEPVNGEVLVNAGETALIFFRVLNKSNDPLIGFSTYEIVPPVATLYFSKIQCFCFHQQMLNPQEELQLPLYFYLEPEIIEDKIVSSKNDDLLVIYKFIKAKKQDLAKMAADEMKRIEENQRVLKEMRRQKKIKTKKELGIKEDELEGDDDEDLSSIKIELKKY